MKISLRRVASPLIIVGVVVLLGAAAPHAIRAASPTSHDEDPAPYTSNTYIYGLNGQGGDRDDYHLPDSTRPQPYFAPDDDDNHGGHNDVPEPGWYILMAAGGLPMGMKLVRRRLVGV